MKCQTRRALGDLAEGSALSSSYILVDDPSMCLIIIEAKKVQDNDEIGPLYGERMATVESRRRLWDLVCK